MWPKMVTSEVRDELEMFESKSWKGVLVKLGARHDSCSTANTTPNSSLDSNDFSNLESAINCKDLWWSETNFAVGDKNILSDCWGNVSAGQVCAILGPSGAGKSSLLNVLAGRVTSGNGRSVKCRVKVGETRIRPVNFRKHIAYVMQDDALLATVTPREAFTLSATLRLSSDTPPHRIKLKVDHLIRELGLEECADVVVGGPLLKGLSGGQRKRTSVGVELATDPSLLLLDEPTTGLDSHSACNLIKLLKDIAQRGSAILCTVHQPSSEVFALFDQVIFMRAGRIAYQGPVESLGSYYANLGHVCPENYNPADFVMTLCQSLSEEEFAKVAMPVPMSSCPILSSKKAEKVEFTLPSSHLQQVYMLAKRDWVGLYRDPSSLIARLGITAALSIVCGCVFWQIGDKDLANPTNYNAHVAMTVFTIIIATNISGHGAILVYPFERPVFLREYDTGTYSAVAYMMSKLLTEVPVLLAQMLLQFMFVKTMSAMQANYFAAVGVAFGVAMVSNSLGMLLAAVASDVKETTEMSVAVFVPQILFTGVFTRLDQIPVFLRWAQYLCGMSYGTKLLFYLEFGPHVRLCQASATAAANCERLLDSGGPTARLWWVNALGLLVLFVVSRLATAAMLVTRAHKH